MFSNMFYTPWHIDIGSADAISYWFGLVIQYISSGCRSGQKNTIMVATKEDRRCMTLDSETIDVLRHSGKLLFFISGISLKSDA